MPMRAGSPTAPASACACGFDDHDERSDGLPQRGRFGYIAARARVQPTAPDPMTAARSYFFYFFGFFRPLAERVDRRA